MHRLGTERSRRPWSLLLVLTLAHVALLLIADPAVEVGLVVAVVFMASVLLWLGVGWLGRVPPATVTIVAGAAILRLVALPLPPALSDDILRYLWDGEVAAAGLNPYVLAPDDAALEGLDPELRERLPHRDVPTVYPPFAVALFALATKLPQSLVALKLLLVLADLLTCRLLISIADRRRVPRARVLLYAWNPLVIFEVAGMGHVDSVGIAAVAMTVLLLLAMPPRPMTAAVAAAMAVLGKIVPLIAWPAWIRQSKKPAQFLWVSSGILAIGFLPVVLAAGGIPPGYIRFGVSWEFNGPLYEPLWRALDGLNAPAGIERILDAAKSWTGWHEAWNRFYPFNYSQLLARLLLAAASIPWFVKAWRHRDPIRSMLETFGVFLLFSTTVYPWYALWVLPWAALAGRRSWLLLAALLPLSYLPQFLDLELFPAVFCAIWMPFLVVVGLERRWFAS